MDGFYFTINVIGHLSREIPYFFIFSRFLWPQFFAKISFLYLRYFRFNQWQNSLFYKSKRFFNGILKYKELLHLALLKSTLSKHWIDKHLLIQSVRVFVFLSPRPSAPYVGPPAPQPNKIFKCCLRLFTCLCYKVLLCSIN